MTYYRDFVCDRSRGCDCARDRGCDRDNMRNRDCDRQCHRVRTVIMTVMVIVIFCDFCCCTSVIGVVV